MKINRFLPLITPLFAYGLLEMFFIWPSLLYAAALLGVIFFFFTAWQFAKNSAFDEKWWNIIILPSLFFLGSISFSIFVSGASLAQLLFFINLIFLHLYFRSIYYLSGKKHMEDSYSLENLSAYGNFLSFYNVL